ncbi:carboxy-S-adenosyl-L-methionine synthase CmoA [Mariprofundus sp. EBB-1]|uniref:carboxy-S-adenosyl-L-methionine synthase CmoA n=1 Tax=Mariprofundus sp. EBB-1 TaxID=2650971 RepID=UPI000EF21D1A|nr:carboxy-S-adenosyl-L-methionine synthase CmoA [Mariprofundus sp. EBB-1]RLL55544.1 carboxy-S-adenosyl-L-methionine synthase CmoA [Mariprofundus sp. EBB-1]
MNHDSIYTSDIHNNGFIFDDKVASVFADMINRSVPGYAQTLQMVELLAHHYAQDNSNLYDLGCSLGAATMALSRGSAGKTCSIIGVDNSPAMVERCKNTLQNEDIEITCQNILEMEITNASVVVLNFVLQFIERDKRLMLLENIQQGLKPGGILIISEKIAFSDTSENRRQIALHEAFKRAQGYSELEISRKRTALEHVLIPETLDIHHARLKQAGFTSSDTWFQCFNFSSMIAIK